VSKESANIVAAFNILNYIHFLFIAPAVVYHGCQYFLQMVKSCFNGDGLSFLPA
jgi:hypothetical protein